MVGITTSSAKAKGRKLQQWVRDLILAKWPKLTSDDVRSTSMGASGEDVLLSPLARKSIWYSIECKARASISIYSYYEQAEAAAQGKYEPLLIVRANRKKALAIVDAEHFFDLVKERDNTRKSKNG